jgi:hypothetical protein
MSKDQEIIDHNNNDKAIVDHANNDKAIQAQHAKDGAISYSQWAEGHTGGDFEPGNL